MNAEARAERRQQILDAAHRCFVRRGFHASSTAEISSEAGISVAGLYQYFPTKQDLVTALIQHELEADLALIQQLDRAADLLEGLQQVAMAVVRDSRTPQAAHLRLEILAEAARDAGTAKVFLAAERRINRALSRVIRKGQEQGSIDRDLDPMAVAEHINAFLDGAFSRLTLPITDPEAFVRGSIELIRRALSAKS
ncbi:TetR/AcrR family transcriptional regulator [Silanimonas sp.]|uniref:TetR/AcrR family transcriptional regulator n=1 Tax=Silanimonas sp. TaxID=1929290 RepID=UPI0022C84F06|nr:TetR/AcrR family transcriptional regulator [Silanimonas sp.]MCZ8063588.1 TetR/AcrR family transcriptional regulator [Silanimonas sp.]